MFDFNSLGSAKKIAQIKGDKKQEQFYHLYDGALDKFRKLVRNQNLDPIGLKEISYQLLEALKLVKNQAEPYLFMAYIFYIIGDKSSAIKYLKVSSFLNPDLAGIERLREAIATDPVQTKINYHNVSVVTASSTNNTANNNRAPPKISSIRRIERK